MSSCLQYAPGPAGASYFGASLAEPPAAFVGFPDSFGASLHDRW